MRGYHQLEGRSPPGDRHRDPHWTRAPQSATPTPVSQSPFHSLLAETVIIIEGQDATGAVRVHNVLRDGAARGSRPQEHTKLPVCTTEHAERLSDGHGLPHGPDWQRRAWSFCLRKGSPLTRVIKWSPDGYMEIDATMGQSV